MIFKNQAVVLTKQKKKLSLYNLEIPKLSEGYVLVKMKYSGICHTQLNEINGILGKDKFLPHCIGHEGVGEIIKKGKNVKNFNIGDTVVVSWIKKKVSKKYNPIAFNSNRKKINTSGCNTLLKYTVVSDNRIFKINKKNKFLRESILLGCALPTASNAILNVAKIKKNSKVLIMGMGGLGYSSLFVLNYLKCKDIVCIDSNSRRLKLIKNQKNCKFVHLEGQHKLDIFIENNFEKFDLIIDCTGSKKLIEKTFSLCKKFIGKFILIGNTKINEKISINAWDVIFGKTLTGAWGYGGTVMNNFEINQKILIDQIKNIKQILPKKNYQISQINNAINDFIRGKVLRPIIKF